MFSTLRYFVFSAIAMSLVACGGSVLDNEEQSPDPVVVEVPIAYIKRDLVISEGLPIRDLREPSQFIPGASLILKRRASASAEEIDLTQRLIALMLENATGESVEVPESGDQTSVVVDENGEPIFIDIKDLENDYSGEHIIFAARLPDLDELAAIDFVPTWDIYEYSRSDEQLRRVIASDASALAGNDTGPSYLADGRIVFSSTRQRGNQARLLDEGKPQYSGLEESLQNEASVLHLMDADGSDITQISYNQSHDLDPSVLPNGKILFSRWDQVAGNKGLNLYQINADGSDLTLMYGRHSHNSVEGVSDVQYANTSVTPQGQVLYGIDSFADDLFNTTYLSIDIENYIDNEQPIDGQAGVTDNAQSTIFFDSISLIEEISPGGYINALYPLWDGSERLIFAWSQCRLFQPLPEGVDPNDEDVQRTIAPCSPENIESEGFEQAPPVYGLWMYDPALGTDSEEGDDADTQLALTIPQENIAISEVVAMESRPFPANPESSVDTSNQQLIGDGYGSLHIASVYDLDGADTSPLGIANTRDPLQLGALARPAQFLRVVKSVSIPDDEILEFDNSAFGRSREQLMREILGYTPIQPDGSVEVAIPANVPFTIEILDINGKRISERHNNWLQLVPGEQKSCIGCHASDSTLPHGRSDAQPVSINTGAPNTGVPFPNTNPALFADLGESMAQTRTRIGGLARLTSNIAFEDVWANPDLQVPSPSFEYAYADLDTALPISQACAQTWTAICRSVINYPVHIGPIFELERQIVDELGMLLQDNTCTACHSPLDSDGMARVPAGQLDLSNTPSSDDPDILTSYRELLFNDNEQALVEGALVDRIVPVLDANGNQVFARDEDGELILDGNGDPIPLTTTVGVAASMFTQGAVASGAFFAPFAAGASHNGMLSDAELRLIAEWLDIGAQYYNNPFDAPQD